MWSGDIDMKSLKKAFCFIGSELVENLWRDSFCFYRPFWQTSSYSDWRLLPTAFALSSFFFPPPPPFSLSSNVTSEPLQKLNSGHYHLSSVNIGGRSRSRRTHDLRIFMAFRFCRPKKKWHQTQEKIPSGIMPAFVLAIIPSVNLGGSWKDNLGIAQTLRVFFIEQIQSCIMSRIAMSTCLPAICPSKHCRYSLNIFPVIHALLLFFQTMRKFWILINERLKDRGLAAVLYCTYEPRAKFGPI